MLAVSCQNQKLVRAWTPRLSAAALVRCPIIIAALAGTWAAVTVTMPSLVRGQETRFSSSGKRWGYRGSAAQV